MELAEFLVDAKKYTYSYGGSREYRSLDDGSLEFLFRKENFEFRDRYFGFDDFAGEEVVFLDGEPVWILNYCGSFLGGENFSNEIVYQFLRKALLTVNMKYPFRGGKYFSEDEYTYINHIEGNMDKFQGEEFILFKGKKIYVLSYQGGKIS